MIALDLPRSLTLRAAVTVDRALLLEVYAGTREAELRPLPWSEEQKRDFVSAQFAAQDASYRTCYPDGDFLVIEHEGVAVGRLYLARLPDDELRVVDIALLGEHAGKGIGTALLTALLARADEEGVRVSLHVERWNPARRLYDRLGFVEAGANEIYLLLERDPAVVADGVS